MRKALVVAFGLLCVIGAASPVPASGAVHAARPIYRPSAQPLGISYSAWAGAYQIWLNEIPAPENPINGPATPRNCEVQASGAVFLGPAGAECSVPEGAPLVFTGAVAFWECSTAEGLGDTFPQLRGCARNNFAQDLNPTTYRQRLAVDGVRVRNLRRWIFLTPDSMIDFPEENIWDAVPGPSKSVTKGFLWIARPLAIGHHRIHLNINDEVIGRFRFAWDVDVERAYP